MFFEQQIRILERFLKDHVTGVMTLKIQLWNRNKLHFKIYSNWKQLVKNIQRFTVFGSNKYRWWAEETSLKNINLYCSKTSVHTHTHTFTRWKQQFTKKLRQEENNLFSNCSYILRYKSSIIQMQFSTEKKCYITFIIIIALYIFLQFILWIWG